MSIWSWRVRIFAVLPLAALLGRCPAMAEQCPELYPICYWDGDCVAGSCAGGCTWSAAPGVDTEPGSQYNYIDGYNAHGTPCSANHGEDSSRDAEPEVMPMSVGLLVAGLLVAAPCGLYMVHLTFCPGCKSTIGCFPVLVTGHPHPHPVGLAVSLVFYVAWLWYLPWNIVKQFVENGVTFLPFALIGIFVFICFCQRESCKTRCRGALHSSSTAAVHPVPVLAGSRQASRTDLEVKVIDEEGHAGALSGVEFPRYWTNSKAADTGFDQMVYITTDSHGVFDELLRLTYKPIVTQDRPCPKTGADRCHRVPGGCPCVRPGGDPGLPTAYVVRRVIRVEDSEMWQRYATRRDAIQARRAEGGVQRLDPPVLADELADKHPGVLAPLDEALNEVYLWHGTGVRIALSIAQNDFNITLAGSNAGTMYGRGAYMTESSTKADEYASDEPGGYYDGIFAMVLVRACMGQFYYTTGREPDAGDKVASGDYDSTLGDRAASVNTYREFVVYDSDQVYPEFVVLYSRVFASDDEAAIREGALQPFHMELPVYWSNCHRNPNSESFSEQYKVRQKTQGLVQHLVSGTATQHSPTVVEVHRVENSAMWNRYVDFRRSVQMRDLHCSGPCSSGGAPVVFDLPGVRSQHNCSDSYYPFWHSERLPSKVESVSVKCQWRDQDWGNKKGRMRAVLIREGEQKVVVDLFGVCRADGRTGFKGAMKSLSSSHPLVSKAQPGDSIMVEFCVGGGGGHELHIKDFHCTIQMSGQESCDARNEVMVNRCMQPNELDGNVDSGHALTAMLLGELDAEECISMENVDENVNEMFLWHGTSCEAADAITKSGFRIPRSERAAHGKRFGEGAYFAEDLSKSLTYTTPEDGVHYVLLCRTTCGELYYTEDNHATDAHRTARSEGKDSVLANPQGQGPREFIVLDECQVYPEFIVKLTF